MQVQSVETKLMKALNGKMHKRWFDDCISVDSTISSKVAQASNWQFFLQALNRRLDKSRIDDCTSDDSSVIIVEFSVLVIIFKKVVRFLSSKMLPSCHGFFQKYIWHFR